MLAGHSGAGASTIALAIADAAAAAGRGSQIIEAAPASRSGLVSAASRELDVDESGAWRRGTRPHPATSVAVTITRRTEDRQPTGWPAVAAADESLIAVDLGLVPTGSLSSSVAGGSDRGGLPGQHPRRPTHRAAARPPRRPAPDVAIVVAMLGGRRWPGEVTASCGPRLRALRDAGRIVTVPLDGHLAVTGPTHSPLPKPVARGRPRAAGADRRRPPGRPCTTDSAQTAPRRKGTTR